MADGETYKEALENIQVVIDEWLETAKLKNRPIPKSKGKLMYALKKTNATKGIIKRPVPRNTHI
ncbi:MAG: type II toxin-antitoxin system HicB family antitoxin [Flavobacteriaceae bacterium]